MPIVKWDPFKDLLSIQERMNRLFEAALSHTDLGGGDIYSGWSPLADFYDDEQGATISIELPGIRENDIDISISQSALTVSGDRKMDRETKGGSYHRIERAYGVFSRTFMLPPGVETEKVCASFKNGVLNIFLPKKEESKPKKIKVRVSGS
ncbi:MAG: Hsp20/alpha crystallin family protein [Acidobacteriota bacterium]